MVDLNVVGSEENKVKSKVKEIQTVLRHSYLFEVDPPSSSFSAPRWLQDFRTVATFLPWHLFKVCAKFFVRPRSVTSMIWRRRRQLDVGRVAASLRPPCCLSPSSILCSCRSHSSPSLGAPPPPPNPYKRKKTVFFITV